MQRAEAVWLFPQVHPRSHWAATRSWMYLLRQQDPVYSKVRKVHLKIFRGDPQAQDHNR